MKVQTYIRLTLCLLLLSIRPIQSDNPVLCKLHQITGEWDFYFDAQPIRKGSRSEYDNEADYWQRLSCGRGQPTKLVENTDTGEGFQRRMISEIQNGPGSQEEDASLVAVRFHLSDEDNSVYQVSSPADLDGEWTMVVHEGLQGFVNTDIGFYRGMLTFNNFFRYNLVGDETFESVCYETMVGWYHTMAAPGESTDDELWGCFYGIKVNPSESDLDKETHITFEDAKPVFDNDNEIESTTCNNNQKQLAERGESTWTPDEYAEVAADSYSLAAGSPTLGRESGAIDSSNIDYNTEGRLDELRQLGLRQFVGMNPDCIPDEALPEYFNWADINGYSFFGEIRNQACGDCYLVAFQGAFESRMNIMSNGRIRTQISNQQHKDCNFYVEGCKGGLPINIAKYGWEFDLVDEQCYPASNIQDPLEQTTPKSTVCNYDAINNCPSDLRYSVEDYYYVGTNYGGVSESLMMREVLAHGPVTIITEVPSYLGAYDTGVLMDECPVLTDEISAYLHQGTSSPRLQMRMKSGSRNQHRISTESLWDRGIEWEMVNHSVVIVGWGISTDESEIPRQDYTVGDDCPAANDGAYWIIANSWGTSFGEDGFFRVRRGCNDFAIETQALSIIPLLDDSIVDPTYLQNSRQQCS